MAHLRLGTLILVALVAGACGPETTDEGPITIGVIVSTSGDLAPVGDHLTKAVQLARNEVNSAGGLLGGRMIELDVRDDQTNPDVAALRAAELIDEAHVVGIIGSLASSASLRVGESALPAAVPQISCCSTSPDLTNAQPETERYFFRTVPSDLAQALVIARQAGTLTCTRLAIMHLNDAYGTPFGAAIRENYLALNPTGTVVVEVPFAPGRPDYSAEVQQIADATPDCVALVAFVTSGGSILRAWSTLAGRPAVTWIGTDGIRDDGIAAAAGGAVNVDGVVGTAPITAPDTPAYADFAANYSAAFGTETGIFGGNQYDAAMLLLLAIEAAGSTEGPAIRDALYRIANDETGSQPFFGPGQVRQALARIQEGIDVNYEGASGPVNIDSFGNVLTDYEIWRYNGATSAFERIGVVPVSELGP